MDNKLNDFMQCINNHSPDNNQGLFNGNTGLIISLYCLSRITRNKEIDIMAGNLLDRVFSTLSSSNATPNFDNGLAGIGWGIEFLVQSGFVEGDTEEILEEVDDVIFKTISGNNVDSFELTDGLVGYLCYLNRRLSNNRNSMSISFRTKKELLIHIINELGRPDIRQFSGIQEEHFDLYWVFSPLIFTLIESYHLNLYNKKIEKIFQQWLIYLNVFIPTLHINRIYLALTLQILNRVINMHEIEKHVHTLLFSTNCNEAITEYDPNQNNIRYGWPGAIWLLEHALSILPTNAPNNQDLINTHKLLKRKFVSTDDQFSNYSLQNPFNVGINSICLMDLLWPKVFSSYIQNMNK